MEPDVPRGSWLSDVVAGSILGVAVTLLAFAGVQASMDARQLHTDVRGREYDGAASCF